MPSGLGVQVGFSNLAAEAFRAYSRNELWVRRRSASFVRASYPRVSRRLPPCRPREVTSPRYPDAGRTRRLTRARLYPLVPFTAGRFDDRFGGAQIAANVRSAGHRPSASLRAHMVMYIRRIAASVTERPARQSRQSSLRVYHGSTPIAFFLPGDDPRIRLAGRVRSRRVPALWRTVVSPRRMQCWSGARRSREVRYRQACPLLAY